MSKGFMKAGHLPTLFAAFLYFDLSFMVWVLLGPLGVAIARELHLDPAHKGLMVATPVLAGAVLRLPLGLLVDRFRAKRVGVGAQVVVEEEEEEFFFFFFRRGEVFLKIQNTKVFCHAFVCWFLF